MTRRVAILVIATSAICSLSGFKLAQFMQERGQPLLVHKLKVPLMLTGAPESPHRQYLLPAGTSLYFDQAFPEGFVRYKVYVNVEGVSLDPKPPTEKFWLDPLVAFPVENEQLSKLLKDYPLTKDELREILASDALSKTEIRALLTEYSNQD